MPRNKSAFCRISSLKRKLGVCGLIAEILPFLPSFFVAAAERRWLIPLSQQKKRRERARLGLEAAVVEIGLQAPSPESRFKNSKLFCGWRRREGKRKIRALPKEERGSGENIRRSKVWGQVVFLLGVCKQAFILNK